MKCVLQSFIDIEVWDQAKWLGVLWMARREAPPAMGLLYRDGEAGKAIFQSWRKRLGPVDSHEQLRVSIIEGPIPGRKPGYTVRVGTHIPHYLDQAGESGNDTVLLTASRIHRMTPTPRSPNLMIFKTEFQKHRQYEILPVSGDPQKPDTLVPHWDLAIEKSEIYFRQVEEIEKGDFDSDILPPD